MTGSYMRQSKHHVFFVVVEFSDNPDVVTRIMGVEPTLAWSKGDPFPNNPDLKRNHSRWTLQSELSLTEPIDAHLENLLPRLEERRENIREVCRLFEAELRIVAYWYEANPGFCLTAEVLRRITDLGLDIDFDFYCLPPDEEDAD